MYNYIYYNKINHACNESRVKEICVRSRAEGLYTTRRPLGVKLGFH